MTLASEPFVIEPQSDMDGPFRMLAGGDRTARQVSFGDGRLDPYAPGPPRHVHKNEDEAFHVIEGVMSFEVDGRRFEAGPGTLVWLPREHPPAFSNLSAEPVYLVGIIVPSGLEGMFEEHARYFSTLTGPPDEGALATISARYGVTILGPSLSGREPAEALAVEHPVGRPRSHP